MKISEILASRRVRFFLLGASVFGLIYIILRLLVFDEDPIIPFLQNFSYYWLGWAENLASVILDKLELEYYIKDHQIFYQGESLYDIHPNFLSRKFLLGLLIMIWLFPVGIRNQLPGTIILLVLHLGFTSIDLVILLSRATQATVTDHSAFLVAQTPLVLMMISFFSFWILKFRTKIYPSLEKLKINVDFIERKLPDILVIIYIYGFLNNFILGWFDYFSWIQFLFYRSAEILAWFDYDAEVYMTYLIGQNGSIYMEKGCLGFGTMALFGMVVFLTADNVKRWWIYVIAGIVFLNIVNILRFVFLFIHIQKNNGYALAMDVHDMYNLIIYAVVFILWVLWFELFALKANKKKTKKPEAN